MNLPRTLTLRLALLTMMVAALGCSLPASSTPEVDDASVALTVQAVLAQQATAAPPTAVPPTDAPPTPEISVTPTLPPTFTPTPTHTPVPLPCDAAQFVTDVTIADDSTVFVNAEFTKTWRLRNSGTCTWTSGYQLVFDHGDRMSAPDAVMLTTGSVPPGSTVDVSVTLKAPAATGTYQGFFKLRNPSGVLFGIGSDGQTAFWVKIKAETFLLLQPIPMIPLLPIISSSGTGMDLPAGTCFNLDGGASLGCSSSGADFKYVYELMTQDKIDPRGSVSFSARFTTEPAYADCRDAAYSSSTFDPSENRWYCYQTTEGKYGWIKVRDTGMFALRFDWTTW